MTWFSRTKIGDAEQAVIQSPVESVRSEKTFVAGSRSSTAVDTNSKCPSKLNKATQKKEERRREKEKDAIMKRETSKTVTIPLEKYPEGYPRLAAFQSSESSFSIYRSFGYLHSRVILSMQNELHELEDNLKDLDNADLLVNKKLLTSCQKAGAKRATLLSTIGEKLVRYDEVLMKAREMNAFQRPGNRDYGSLRRWFYYKGPLIARDADFIKRREDLVTLRQGREWAGFDGWIESSIKRLPVGLAEKLFTTPELRAKTKDPKMRYYSPERIERLVGILITLIIFILLVLPVVAMYKLTSVGNRNSTIDAVGLLVVFTLLFSAAMSMLTKAKRHELFAASAAYCAVLVVFISNFSNDGNGGGIGIGA